jgi:transcriptional antiterminator RfaH
MPSSHQTPAWFCLRTQPKHEHIAAACLRADFGIEAYLPRISFKRPTARGPVRFTEALFPNYLFARFSLSSRLLAVQYTQGVRDIVHFGDKWPAIPEATIAELRASFDDAKVHVIPDRFAPGDRVEIAGGAFHGLPAVVLRVMPSRERVAVLLDFLGRQTTVEMAKEALIRPGMERAVVWRSPQPGPAQAGHGET